MKFFYKFMFACISGIITHMYTHRDACAEYPKTNPALGKFTCVRDVVCGAMYSEITVVGEPVNILNCGENQYYDVNEDKLIVGSYNGSVQYVDGIISNAGYVYVTDLQLLYDNLSCQDCPVGGLYSDTNSIGTLDAIPVKFSKYTVCDYDDDGTQNSAIICTLTEPNIFYQLSQYNALKDTISKCHINVFEDETGSGDFFSTFSGTPTVCFYGYWS